jgi:UDP:flavonoid glycosyltransferase YjiC (YdhE family)
LKVIVTPFGSAGDVHPFLGLGLALRQRGHEVVFVAESYFAALIESNGFRVRSYGEPGKFEEVINDPRLWHPRKSIIPLFEAVLRGLRPVHEGIAEEHEPGKSVVASGALALGALVARESLGIPLATAHLAPAAFRSVHDTPILGQVRMPAWLPKSWKRGLYWAMDRVIDRHLASGLNGFRSEFGLPPIRRVLADWWYSSDVNLAMFPEWYAPRQPDWPSNVVVTGFPLYDESDVSPIPEEASRFLDSGSPPIVFAAGTAMTHANSFFAESVEVCRKMGRRGILVTKFPAQLPTDLPEGVRHFPYLPFSQLLPRASAIVHHGGIGTTSQALLAGIPMLIRPMAHDQRDNAARLSALGVASSLLPKNYNARTASEALNRLIGSTEVRTRAQALSSRLSAETPLERACEAIEGMRLRVTREATARNLPTH